MASDEVGNHCHVRTARAERPGHEPAIAPRQRDLASDDSRDTAKQNGYGSPEKPGNTKPDPPTVAKNPGPTEESLKRHSRALSRSRGELFGKTSTRRRR